MKNKFWNKKIITPMIMASMSGAIVTSTAISTSCSSTSLPAIKYELSSSSTVAYGATLTITASYTGELVEGEVFQWGGFSEGNNNGIVFSLSEADDKSILTITNSNSADEDKIFTSIIIAYNGKSTSVEHIICKEQSTVITSSITTPTSINWYESLVITVSATHNHSDFTWKNINSDQNVEFELSNGSGVNDTLTINNINATNSLMLLSNIKVSCNGSELLIPTITIFPQATVIDLDYSLPIETGNITVPYNGQLVITASSTHFVGKCKWNKPANGNGITYVVSGDKNEILTITNNNSNGTVVIPANVINVTNNYATKNVPYSVTLPIIEIGLSYSIGPDASGYITIPYSESLTIIASDPSGFVDDCVWTKPDDGDGITYVPGGG